MAEMLLSLAALGIAALFLIPAISFIWEKGERASVEKNSRQMMYTELIRSAAEGADPISITEKIGGTVYKLYIKSNGDGSREVCVTYEHPAAGTGTVCGYLE
ncbi:type II secretion system protein [Neobacillus piezotolerans]|uniref:type II secretion system protein n=1 Tax=Neobacillus piezotolerans TaxID=2259171 RepID=UPI00115BA31E|nr:hypothetical protein [Neobacillus piezotolerans]